MGVKTAVLMMNLGGPRTVEEVKPYLVKMFSDKTFIGIPFGLGPMIGSLRAKAKEKQYSAIGGSPLRIWTEKQGAALTNLLDSALPEHAPFRSYPTFRYSEPFAASAVKQALAEGAEKLILFTQYPHYSCATTGNSLRDVLSHTPESVLDRVSVISRWPTHPSYIKAWKSIIEEQLSKFPGGGKDVQVVFSAHSVPATVVWKGDMYPYEIGSTVTAVMDGLSNPYSLMWQSKVGFQTWLQPSTHAGLLAYAKQGMTAALVVPIAFTNEHLETLYELDLEYIPEIRAAGMTHLVRCPAPNAHPLFIQALADVVSDHVKGKGEPKLRKCVECRFPEECRKLRDIRTEFTKVSQ